MNVEYVSKVRSHYATSWWFLTKANYSCFFSKPMEEKHAQSSNWINFHVPPVFLQGVNFQNPKYTQSLQPLQLMILLIHSNNYKNPQTTNNPPCIPCIPMFFVNQPNKKNDTTKKKMYPFSLLPFFLVPHLVVVFFGGEGKKQPGIETHQPSIFAFSSGPRCKTFFRSRASSSAGICRLLCLPFANFSHEKKTA